MIFLFYTIIFRSQTAQKSEQSHQVLFSTANSHNIFATKNVAATQNKKVLKNTYNKRLAMVESKLLNSNCYQRANKVKNNSSVNFLL